jgi:hypothetical protein
MPLLKVGSGGSTLLRLGPPLPDNGRRRDGGTMTERSISERPIEPSPALAALGQALVGSWKLAGGADGLIKYEWAEGRLFLMQHIDLVVFGRPVKGLEVIGHLRRVGEESTQDIWSRFYSFKDGLTLDYIYEINGRAFMIWFIRKDSNNSFNALLSDDGRSYKGAWAWPGGGYEVTATKVA